MGHDASESALVNRVPTLCIPSSGELSWDCVFQGIMKFSKNVGYASKLKVEFQWLDNR